MTTNLLTTGNVDFDNCFEAGSGTQLLYHYAMDGTDIGQKYLPVSKGSAYGTTGFLAANGTDVGNLLCKKGTADDGSVVMTCGYFSVTLKKTSYYWGWGTIYYGMIGSVSSKNIGSVNRRPYWLDGSTQVILEGIIYNGTITYLDFSVSKTYPISSINGVSFSSGSVSGNPLSLSNGKTITLKFTPSPAGFA